MKTLKPKHQVERTALGWNRTSTLDCVLLEVEHADVGTARHHYQGFERGHYTFTKADVGKVIEELSGGLHRSRRGAARPWLCWSFVPKTIPDNEGYPV